MAIKVNVYWPEDMEALENKAAEKLSEILVKKLQPKELVKLIEILKDDSIDIRM